MNAVVIYNSQTGFTKKYAQWISEGAACECMDIKKAAKLDLKKYDSVVFGGWFMAGTISKINWFKKQIPGLLEAGKKVIVYAVGASPEGNPDTPVLIERNLPASDFSGVKTFYCPGGLDYDSMKGFSRFAMKMLVKSLNSKKDASEKEKAMASMLSKSYDISDKKYADAVIEAMN